MKTWIASLNNLLPMGLRSQSSKNSIDATPTTIDTNSCWWGDFSIGDEQSRFFKIGNVVICLDRYNNEWNITTHREGEQPFKSFSAQAANRITLKPVLPDKPILCKLDRPLYIPSGESIQLYISAPVWIRIEAGTAATVIDEIPTEVLPDTWFGNNTRDGELCYANRYPCSPYLDDLIRDTTSITIPFLITNQTKSTMLIETLKVPLNNLSIYRDAENSFWTEQLHLRHDDKNPVLIDPIVQGVMKTLKTPERISQARLPLKQKLHSLFNPFTWK